MRRPPRQAAIKHKEALRTIAQVESQVEIANDAAFKASMTPPYLRRLQTQLISLNLVDTRSYSYGSAYITNRKDACRGNHGCR